ncbi:hypothetical protein RJ640_006023 [Escallonia rubra]|uniref:Uncharacterized protein n=1 Tax=Escallonia rubra TaxID=112253 RepID=A0AA88UCA3_9ASTE|nr:hypothetical protein RJ640_006023 [Escallonia rubra]
MSSNRKVHSHGNVPFSWENKPGVSKAAAFEEEFRSDEGRGQSGRRLPPPPCPPEQKARASFHDLQVPLPPCAFQGQLRSSSKRGLRYQDDPFLMAYKECTKTTRKGKVLGVGRDDIFGHGFRKKMSNFSCKQSCSVMEDSMVRISQLPISKSQRERDGTHHP